MCKHSYTCVHFTSSISKSGIQGSLLDVKTAIPSNTWTWTGISCECCTSWERHQNWTGLHKMGLYFEMDIVTKNSYVRLNRSHSSKTLWLVQAPWSSSGSLHLFSLVPKVLCCSSLTSKAFLERDGGADRLFLLKERAGGGIMVPETSQHTALAWACADPAAQHWAVSSMHWACISGLPLNWEPQAALGELNQSCAFAKGSTTLKIKRKNWFLLFECCCYIQSSCTSLS